ncbi:MAG TPA: radical SAM protein [Longimicrobium sp.]|nr:radical SAM protein [Longimicrobium sp.]
MSGRGDSLFLLLTERCNLQCRHCYVFGGPDAGTAMAPGIAAAALGIAEVLDIHHVTLTGGEPTTHPAFREILGSALDREFRVRLVTNGKLALNGRIGSDLLARLEHTWFSLYGPTRPIHESTAGRNAPDFDDVVSLVADLTAAGCSAGLSVLLVPGATSETETLLQRAGEMGVRKVRLIPLQPDGRARITFPVDWGTWPAELAALAGRLRERGFASRFESLTLNDPFDLLAQYGTDRSQSCLLHSRRMWSVVPSGDIYPCCFTAYEERSRVGNLADAGVIGRLRNWAAAPGLPACRAVEEGFWKGIDAARLTCPISSVPLVQVRQDRQARPPAS